VIGYTQYKELDTLMPLDVDDTVTSRWGVSLVLGSPVLSLVISVDKRSEDGQVCLFVCLNICSDINFVKKSQFLVNLLF
jgi:hypothetical protein